LAFLLNWVCRKATENLDLFKWKTETVQECLHWIQAVVKMQERTADVQELEEMLLERLRTKRTRFTHRPEERKKGGLLNFIKVFHTNKLVNATKFRQVLHDPSVVLLHPDRQAASSLQVCDKLTAPLLRILGNFTKVAYEVHSGIQFQEAAGSCRMCALLRGARDCREVEGHLVALDPGFIEDFQVREWLEKGAKYRLDRDPRGVAVAIREGLTQYIEIYGRAYRCTPEQIDQLEKWKEKIIEFTQQNLQTEAASKNEDVQENEKLRRIFMQWQQNLVVVPVDKAGHNIAFVCKQWYEQKLRTELAAGNGAYQDAEETVDDVLRRHKEVNRKFGFEHFDAFPYLYGILKAHKQPVQLRYIAGCSRRGGAILQKCKEGEQQAEDHSKRESEESFIRRMTREKNAKPKCSITDAAKEGVKLLRIVMDTLREREEQCYKRTGIRKWWTVESIEEVALAIKDGEQQLVGKKMRTADFTTMYTMLPHGRLIATVQKAWDRAVEYEAIKTDSSTQQFELKQDHEGRYCFVPKESAESKEWDKEKYMELMEFLITDNHIWNGKELRRQSIGIPMGSPVSPHLANLYRYVVEAEFVEGLLADGKMEEAAACAYTFGYIDDLCTFDGPLPTAEHYGIPMTVDPSPREAVNFLGMKITANNPNRSPRLSIVEKQEEWNLNVIKYPHASSNVPWNQGAAVFKGQLIRYAVICNNLWDFQTATVRLAGRLLQRGYRTGLLIATWRRYLEERWPQQVAHKYRMQDWFQVAITHIMHQASKNVPLKSVVRRQAPQPPIESKGNSEVVPHCAKAGEEADSGVQARSTTGFQEVTEDIHIVEDDVSVDKEDNEEAKSASSRDSNSTLHNLLSINQGQLGQEEEGCEEEDTAEDKRVTGEADIQEIFEVSLPLNTKVVRQEGDGSCLFHAISYILSRSNQRPKSASELRAEIADFIEQRAQISLNGKPIFQWICELNEQSGHIGDYAEQLRRGMYGGLPEILVASHMFQVQLLVLTQQNTAYRCIFSTRPGQETKGHLWYHGENLSAHFDVLEPDPLEEEKEQDQHNENEGQPKAQEKQCSLQSEDAPEVQTESEEEATKEPGDAEKAHEESEVECEKNVLEYSQLSVSASKKRTPKRHRLTVKKATTHYNQSCGICGEQHTRRRASIECICRSFVHLSCLGYKTRGHFEEQEVDMVCKCKKSHTQLSRKADELRKANRVAKLSHSRNTQGHKDLIHCALIACAAIVPFVACELSLIQARGYVKLHGLKRTHYNGKEGQVMKRDGDKAVVELAGTLQILRVHCKHLTLLPTYRVARCKLRKHCITQVTFEPEPVWGWPEKLTGTYYDFLQVQSTAGKEAIKTSFKKLSVVLHPDKNPTNATKATHLFKQVLEAYECLKDDVKRAVYDQQLLVRMYQHRMPTQNASSSAPKWQWAYQ
jgi:hypothetical protein